MQFSDFGRAVAQQFQTMGPHGRYKAQVEKDTLWETYLASFPEGSNPIFRERTEHDCQCCRSFIRTVGGVVSIVDNNLVSIWDISIGGDFQVVADAMAALVKSSPIDNIFLHTERTAGTAKSFEAITGGDVRTWDHFFVNIPPACVVRGVDIGPKLSESRSTKDVMLRGLKEITAEALDTVLELIAQNSLYRGSEQLYAVKEFQTFKRKFDEVSGLEQDLFVWKSIRETTTDSVSRIRNTAIGTLLVDLSEGKDLDDAVKSFETKVAPANYKRPTALVTKGMIQKAQATIEELGLTSALERRYATVEDITVNNILFANREAKKAMNVFEELASKTPEKTKNLDKVEELPIETFISNVLPKAESLEIMFENRHSGNLVSLIAPADPTAKNLFKWPNNFSWSYAGDLADSIKERVKKAGGKVDGDFRASLSWFNHDDLDLHLIEPTGHEIYYAAKISPYTKGQLDVDMNAGHGATRNAVENIFYSDRKQMKDGNYRLFVHNFSQRETKDVGFEVEIEFDGTVHSFSYAKAVKQGEKVVVADFHYTKSNGLKSMTSGIPSTQASKELWGVPTQTFHKVNIAMLSPNHWDGHPVGNKHYFFMLDGCKNGDKARGFFNEFLREDLNAHRKVIEVVGSKMKTEESDRQLSGLGFSSTQRNHVLARVKGSFSRTVKITF